MTFIHNPEQLSISSTHQNYQNHARSLNTITDARSGYKFNSGWVIHCHRSARPFQVPLHSLNHDMTLVQETMLETRLLLVGYDMDIYIILIALHITSNAFEEIARIQEKAMGNGNDWTLDLVYKRSRSCIMKYNIRIPRKHFQILTNI